MTYFYYQHPANRSAAHRAPGGAKREREVATQGVSARGSHADFPAISAEGGREAEAHATGADDGDAGRAHRDSLLARAIDDRNDRARRPSDAAEANARGDGRPRAPGPKREEFIDHGDLRLGRARSTAPRASSMRRARARSMKC